MSTSQKPSKLFEPGKIGTMELKNRIIMAPMGVPRTATPDGYLTKEFLAYYEERAKGGVGMIQMSISTLGGRWGTGPFFAPGSFSVMDDDHVPGARRFVDVMHSYGVKVTNQITHHGVVLSGALKRLPPEKRPPGLRVVAPSAVPFALTGEVPHALTVAEIDDLIEAYVDAARRGKSAGFDAVRIQGCHGYLVHQFLSPRTNKRTDEYGGSLENRARFACDITRRIRQEVGPDYPIIMRINGDDFLEGGITVDQAVEHARMIVDAGVDAVDVSGGPFESHHWQFITQYQPSGPLVPAAAAIKKAVKVPVFAVGKIDPQMAERILEDGSADFVQFARPLMVDPQMPNKAREGRWEDIRPCIYCDTCFRRGEAGTQCAVNPAFSKELEFKLVPAPKPKNVLVVGGGVAGMEAARTLAERGHKVSLYEKGDRLGGQRNIVSGYKPEHGRLVEYMAKALKAAGVNVVLGRNVNLQTIDEVKPDAVVVAAGSKLVLPANVPGIDDKKVVLASDVLSGRVDTGNDVVVVGDGTAAIEAAMELGKKGKKVSLVSERKIAWTFSHNMKLAALEYLIKYRVMMFPDSKLESVTDRGVHIVWDGGEPQAKAGPRFELLFLPADSVVIALEPKSENALAEQLGAFVPEVYAVGDCVSPRDIISAIHEASAVARRI